MPNKHHISIWWGPPKKFAERLNERKISWLELFYDLVYVAAISQLTSRLTQHTNWSELGYFLLLFSLIFWSWMNGSMYHDLHSSPGIRSRFLTLFQMLAMSAVAITVKAAFEGHHQSFGISFLVIQCLITYNWWSVGYYDPSHKALNRPVYYCLLMCDCFAHRIHFLQL